ncbi:MAG: DNA topoisomerase 3 [Verrucomicrobiales bacterium]
MKTLIIAEKPSVAADLARVLSKAPGMTKFAKEKDHYENETYVISSAIGHLVELALPGEAEGKKPSWKFDSLPILPEKFDLLPRDDGEERLKVLKRLMKRSDVGEIINACDAGREGELIFRYIMEANGVKKPTRRLWMQSMTNAAIEQAFRQLRSDDEMQPLAHAALCRSESDWLVGINATRALTAANSRFGGFRLTPAGRVQTPTLAILVAREKEIQCFEPRTYWEVIGEFGVQAGSYQGRWFGEEFQKDDANPHDRAERLWIESEADAIVARTQGRIGTVSETKKPARQAPPLLYDLTSLQREASNRFGFSARRTLQLAQALYEKHKALTYPRTDSRYLPDDYLGTVRGSMGAIARGADGSPILTNLPGFAARALDENRVVPSRRIFDGSKVSDHFAIIPTGQLPAKLDEAEQKLFDMVVRRFIAVFFPAAEFEVTTRITRIMSASATDAFKTDGKILVVPGWLEVYGKKSVDDDDQAGSLCPVRDGESAAALSIEKHEEATRPPPRYNEATLLSSMEGAGKLVEDEELREAMSERGLGTPATRAAIIEGLLHDGYIARNQRDLVATSKGIALIDQLHEAGVEALASPEMTGQWEYKLKLMEQGQAERAAFMREIRELAAQIVQRTRQYAENKVEVVLPDFPATCPLCGAHGLKQIATSLSCHTPKCGLRVGKTIAQRPMSEAELHELLGKKFLGPLQGFKNRFGKDFEAALEIDAKGKVAFVFPKSPEQEAALEAVHDPANILCPCPVCAAAGQTYHIYDTPAGYTCEAHLRGEATAAAAKKCKPKASLPKVICGKEIDRVTALQFFTEGDTGLIKGMKSKKGRSFDANLLLKLKGKWLTEFKFAPREKPPGGPRKKPIGKKAAPPALSE